jgi:hypothetical protein
MESITTTMVDKLVFSSFTNVIIQCNKPNMSNNTCNYIAINCPIVSFSSNNLTITCMGIQLSLRKLVTRTKVSTLQRNIHKSKLVKTNVVDAKVDKTWWSMVFLTMANNIFSTREDRKRNKTWGHWCNINLWS